MERELRLEEALTAAAALVVIRSEPRSQDARLTLEGLIASGWNEGDTARAMSQENVDAVRAAFEQYSRGDFSALFAAMTDDFEFVTAAEMPDAGSYRGQKAREWLTTYMESFDGFTMEATEVIDAGNKAVSAVLQRGRPRGSEIPVESRWWQVVTFRDDGLARVEMFSQRDQALESAGLSD